MKFCKISTLALAIALSFGTVKPAKANVFNLLLHKKHHAHQRHQRHHQPRHFRHNRGQYSQYNRRLHNSDRQYRHYRVGRYNENHSWERTRDRQSDRGNWYGRHH